MGVYTENGRLVARPENGETGQTRMGAYTFDQINALSDPNLPQAQRDAIMAEAAGRPAPAQTNQDPAALAAYGRGGPAPAGLQHGYALSAVGSGGQQQRGRAIQDTFAQTHPLTVRMPDGTEQQFTGEYWKDEKLAAALDGGGLPVDPVDPSKTMKVTPGVYGGYLFDGLPINTVAGAGFFPGQEEALSNYYAAGYTPGGPALTNPPALPASAGVYYPGGNGGGGNTNTSGSPFDFGYLTKPFDEQFKAPGSAPGAFVPPTGESVGADPGVQYRMSEAQKALDRKSSAGGYLDSGRAFKELNRGVQDVASQEYNLAYNRDLTTHQGAVSDYNSQWDKAMQEYQQRYNIDTGNKTNIFNKLSTTAGGGQVAANQLGGALGTLGTNVGNNTQGGAYAQAQAALIAANARRQAAGNIAGNYSLSGA